MAELRPNKAFYGIEIPSDWEVKRLFELTLKIGSGITPTGGHTVYKTKGRPFLRSQNVGWGTLLLEDIVFIDERTHRTFKSTEIQENDVFLNITGASIGRSSVANHEVLGGNVNQHVCILRTDLSVLVPRYLNSFILSPIGQNLINSFQAGGNRQGLNFEQIKSFKIPLPPLPEQRAIAQVLSTADAAIHTTEKLIAQKEQRKKWLMQNLLTGKMRLKGFEGEWKSEILGNVVSLQHGYQFRDEDFVEDGIPVIKIRNVIGYDLVLSDMTYVKASRLIEFQSVVIENGDLLMSLTGNIGRVVEVTGIDKPMFQNYRVGKFNPIDDQIKKAFLKYVLSSDMLFRQFNGLANQSAQANFGKQDMDKLKFRYPKSSEEQIAIAQVLQTADKEINLLKAKAEKLREQKKGLMQVLLTGKRRIR